MPPTIETLVKKALTPLLFQLYAIAEILEQSVSGLVETNERQDVKERQRNAVFKGIGLSDSWKETGAQTMERVKMLLLKMGLTGTEVTRAVRLGKYRPGFNRPVLCEFASLGDKQQAMRNRRELKGTDVWINNDLPHSVRVNQHRARKEELERRQERAADDQREEPTPSTSTGTAGGSAPARENNINGSGQRATKEKDDRQRQESESDDEEESEETSTAEGGAETEEVELDSQAEEAKSEKEKQAEEKRRGLRSWKRNATSIHDTLAENRKALRWMKKEIEKRRGD